MNSPDPEDTRPDLPRPDTAPDGDGAVPRRAELPGDVDAAFAAIVAEWEAADAPRWPQDATDGGLASGLGTATPPEGHRALDTGPTPARPPRPRDAVTDPGPVPPGPSPAGDEHYLPPEPPPLPRLGLSSLLGLALLVVGVVLLAVPGLLGGPIGLGIVPGLLAMTAGLGWLVFGLRRSRDDDSDDGAVL